MAESVFTSTISSQITDCLNNIMTAEYGETVRENITKALRIIGQTVDDALNDMYKNIVNKSNLIEQNKALYDQYKTEATTAADTLKDFKNVVSSVEERLAAISNIKTETISYERNSGGGWSPVSNRRITSTTKANGEVEWTFHTPGVPLFKNIRIERKPLPKNDQELLAYKDSVDYNINTGEIVVSLADPMKRLRVVGNVLEGRSVNTGEILPTSLDYASDGAPVLSLSLPRGPDGSAGDQLVYRTFFVPKNKALYNNADTSFGPSYIFGEQVLPQLDNAAHISYSNNVNEIQYYSLKADQTPKFDAVLITFRKSINNTSGFEISGVNTSGLSFPDNYDYDSTVTVFVPRGGQATAMMVDRMGRVLTRRVYWLDKTMYRAYSGGSKKVGSTAAKAPVTSIVSDLSGGWSSVNQFNAGRGLLFSHCHIDKVKKGSNVISAGDDPEYSYSSDGNYTYNKEDKCWDPTANRGYNEFCDRFMIPVFVQGIIYQLDDSSLYRFGISVS